MFKKAISALLAALFVASLFGGVTVSAGAEVRDCVILNDTFIGENARVRYVISDKNARLSPYLDLSGSQALPLVIPKGSEI